MFKHSKSDEYQSIMAHWVEVLMNDCEPDEKLDYIVRDAAILFNVPIAMINLLTPELIIFKACVGQTQGDSLERDGSFCDVAVSQEPPLNIVDATKDPAFKDYTLVTNELKIRSYLGKSLHSPDGIRIGTLCLLDNKPRKYTKSYLAILNDLASSAEKEIAIMLGYLQPTIK